MKIDTHVRSMTKLRPQSPAAKISRKLMAIRMNNFFEDRLQESDSGVWQHKEGKKRRSRRARPITATLARPRLLDITWLGRIDMSLMRKELLSVYRLMKVPISQNINISKNKDKKQLKEIEGKEKNPKSGIIVEIKPENHFKIQNDIVKNKSSFRLYPNTVFNAKSRNKIDEVLGVPTNKPLPKPCDSCGRASRPERLHAHPQRPGLSPTRVKASPASARRTTISDNLGVGTVEKLSHLPINRSSSSCDRRRSPNRKIILESTIVDKPKEERRLAEAPPVCAYCGRRFGTSSLPIHEAKCRQKHGKKSTTPKGDEFGDTKPPTISITSPKKTQARESPQKSNRSCNPSPRRKEDEEKPKEDDLHAFYPSAFPPVRRSPINITVNREEELSQSEISDAEYSAKEFTDAEQEVEWKDHLKSLIKCNNCDRAFAPDRIKRHQAICDGSSRRPVKNKTRKS